MKKRTRDWSRLRLMTGALCLSAMPVIAAASKELPSAQPKARYEKMIQKSPFAPATPVAAAATPGFASGLYASGVAKIGNEYFVTVSSRDSQSKFSLFGNEPNQDGIAMVSVEWSEQIGKSKVTVKKGAEFAVLEFDQASLQKPVQATPQMAPGPQPGPQNPQGPRPAMLPRVRQGMQGMQGQGMQPQPYPQAPQGGESRRRIRIINPKPQ